jgi:hypothetical protein
MNPGRWERVLDQKPRPIQEHLTDEVAALFAQDLLAWPPSLEALDPATAEALTGLLAAHPAAPSRTVYVEAFRLTAFDLGREPEAIDDYFRNRRYLEVGLGPEDRGLLQFLGRLMAEQLLALGEATQGRFKRPQLLEVLARTRRALLSSLAGSPQPDYE